MKNVIINVEEYNKFKGKIEFIFRDKNGNEISRHEENIIKIFAKEMLSHRLPCTEIWDPDASSGTGAWVDAGYDPDQEFSPRYILLGASFDTNGVPLDTNDTRYYTYDTITSTYQPVRLGPGAEFDGELINAIPISEPGRPLKKIENVSWQATYQPAGTPLLESDVRAINNIVLFESTLKLDEYNGFGVTNSDYFTICEVALAGGRKITSLGTCEKTPREIFLEGRTADDSALTVILNGTDIVDIDSAETTADVTKFKEGDQIKIVDSGGTAGSQKNAFYLIVSKLGRSLQLDRVPVSEEGLVLTGNYGMFRDTLRIFSHRVLSSPVKKSEVFEILIRWSIIFS